LAINIFNDSESESINQIYDDNFVDDDDVFDDEELFNTAELVEDDDVFDDEELFNTADLVEDNNEENNEFTDSSINTQFEYTSLIDSLLFVYSSLSASLKRTINVIDSLDEKVLESINYPNKNIIQLYSRLYDKYESKSEIDFILEAFNKLITKDDDYRTLRRSLKSSSVFNVTAFEEHIKNRDMNLEELSMEVSSNIALENYLNLFINIWNVKNSQNNKLSKLNISHINSELMSSEETTLDNIFNTINPILSYIKLINLSEYSDDAISVNKKSLIEFIKSNDEYSKFINYFTSSCLIPVDSSDVSKKSEDLKNIFIHVLDIINIIDTLYNKIQKATGCYIDNYNELINTSRLLAALQLKLYNSVLKNNKILFISISRDIINFINEHLYDLIVDNNYTLSESTTFKNTNYTLPKNITFKNGKCIVTCKCGDCVSDEENSNFDITKKRFITFNILNHARNDDMFTNMKLRTISNNSNSTDPLSLFFECLVNNKKLFSYSNNIGLMNFAQVLNDPEEFKILYNYQMQFDPTSPEKKNYFNNLYLPLCTFNIIRCKNCNKYNVLPVKLMQYITNWYIEKYIAIANESRSTLSNSFIVFDDDTMNELLLKYNENYSDFIEESKESYSKNMTSSESYNSDLEEKLVNSISEYYYVNFTNETIKDSNNTSIDSEDITEIYKRVQSRSQVIAHIQSLHNERKDKLKITESIESGINYKITLRDDLYDVLHELVKIQYNADVQDSVLISNYIDVLSSSIDISGTLYESINLLKLLYSYKIYSRMHGYCTDNLSVTGLDPFDFNKVQLSSARKNIIRLCEKLNLDVSNLDITNCVEFDKELNNLINSVAPIYIKDSSNESINYASDIIINKCIEEFYIDDYNDIIKYFKNTIFNPNLEYDIVEYLNDELPWMYWCCLYMAYLLYVLKSDVLIQIAGKRNMLLGYEKLCKLINNIFSQTKNLSTSDMNLLSFLHSLKIDDTVNKEVHKYETFQDAINSHLSNDFDIFPVTSFMLKNIKDKSKLLLYFKKFANTSPYVVDLINEYSIEDDDDYARSILDLISALLPDQLYDNFIEFYNNYF